MHIINQLTYILFIHLQSYAFVNAVDHTSSLVKYLFSRYDRRVRPFSETGQPVTVHASIVLGILIELRENEQVASYVISHTQRWQDPNLAWNQSEHHGIRQVVVPKSMIWLPKIFVYNSMNTKEMLTEDRYDVRIKHDGSIKINIPQYVKCICRLFIEQFPFDTQYCAVALASPLLTVEEMDVISHAPPPDSYFAGNAEWKLQNVTVRHMRFLEESEYRSEIHYIFELKRRPIFYIIVIVVPIFLISTLSILGIFTPGSNDGSRSEKVSLGLGSLMATTVLLGIVAGAMPKSNSIPLLGYYILTVIVLCALAVGFSIALMTVLRRLVDEGELPSDLTYRLMCIKTHKFAVTQLSRIERYSMASLRMSVRGKQAFRTLSNGISASTPKQNGVVAASKEDLTGNGVVKETDSLTADIKRLYERLNQILDVQQHFRLCVEREKTRNLIEREWGKVFIRLECANLILFQFLNIASLIFFLHFAWAPAPPMHEPIV